MAPQQRPTLAPISLERRELTRHNTFEFWSRKLGRAVVLLGPTQFDAALLLEFNRDVLSYCERPAMQLDLLPEGSGRSRALDFWVERRNGHQVGILVFEANRHISEDLLRRSLDAAGLRWEVWLAADLAKRRQLIRNLKQLRPYVSSDEPEIEAVEQQVSEFLSQYRGGRWDQLQAAAASTTPGRFTRTIARMYHDGRVDLDLETLPLSKRTWVKAL